MINYPLFQSVDDLPLEQVVSLCTNDLPIVLITPNPQEADRVRLNLNNPNVIVKTMNGWQIELLGEIDHKLEFADKSHLIRDLAKIWRITLPEDSFSHFMQAYQKLSEWRSFGTSRDLIEGIIDFSHETHQGSLKLLQNYLTQNQVIDEHRAFEIFNNDIDFISQQNFIFWGFTYFSPVQITFFQNLSQKCDLYFPLAKDLYEIAQSQDWISWLKGKSFALKHIERENLGHLYLYQDISSIIDTLKGKKGIIISLADESLVNTETSFLDSKDYKVGFDLYPDKVQKIFSQLLLATINQEITNFDQLKIYLEKNYWEAKAKKDWREIKVISSLLEISHHYHQSIATLDFLDEFEIGLFREIIELDSPRVSLLNQGVDGGEFFWEKEFYSLANKKISCVYLNPGENIFRVAGQLNSVKLDAHLRQLGPVKRSSFGVERKISRLKDYLHSGGSLYLNASDYQDQGDWSEIFQESEKIQLVFSPELKENSEEVIENNQRKINFSPSTIELYQKCPRKFYYQKILQYRFEFVDHVQFTDRDIGNIVHEIIKQHLDLNQLKINIELTKKIFFDHLKQNKIELRVSEINRVLPLLQNYSEHAFLALRKMREFDSEMEFYPEYVVENPQFGHSRADLLALSTNKKMFCIIDWKTGSVPKKSEILSYEKVQLPYYFITLKDKFPDHAYLLAYVSLKDLQTLTLSNIDFNLFEDAQECPTEVLNNFEAKLTELVDTIKTDEKYLCKPSSQNCSYCDYHAICSRQE